MIENATSTFERHGDDKELAEAEKKTDELFSQLGQLKVENDYLKKIQATVRNRVKAVERNHMELSIKKQCELLGISRLSYYHEPVAAADSKEIKLLKAIMVELRVHPFYGYRKIAEAIKEMGVTRKEVRHIMSKAGLRAIYTKKRLSILCKQHGKYPYLLRDINIWLPNQVWAIDITYIKLSEGNVNLVAIMDLWSRKVLS